MQSMIISLTVQVNNWGLKKVKLPELVAELVSPGLSTLKTVL